MKRSAYFIVSLICLSQIGASTASAHDRPPRAQLHVDGEKHKLGTWSYNWTSSGGGGFCSAIHADGFPSYKPEASVDSLHSRPRIYFLRNQRPRVEGFRAYSQLDNGSPTGPSERVDSRLSRVRRDGEVVAWKLRFRTEVVDERYFDLDVSFVRKNRRCGDFGEASYAFGLERE